MVTLKVSISVVGPLLTKDATPGIAMMKKGIITELLQLGESRLDEMLRPRPAGVYLSVAQAQRGKASTGFFRRSVHARHSTVNPTIESNVIYGPWLEGESSRNATTRFKGYASFRKTGQFLQKQAVPLTTRHVNAFIRRMS